MIVVKEDQAREPEGSGRRNNGGREETVTQLSGAHWATKPKEKVIVLFSIMETKAQRSHTINSGLVTLSLSICLIREKPKT